MKRRIAKKEIRKIENALKHYAGRRIFDWERASFEEKDDIIFGLRVFLEGLIASGLRQSHFWKDEWIDEIVIRSSAVEEKNVVKIGGYMWLGLLSDIGGEQWRELIVAKIQWARKPNYSITFGKKGARVTVTNIRKA